MQALTNTTITINNTSLPTHNQAAAKGIYYNIMLIDLSCLLHHPFISIFVSYRRASYFVFSMCVVTRLFKRVFEIQNSSP